MDNFQRLALEAWEETLSDGNAMLRMLSHSTTRVISTGELLDHAAKPAEIGGTPTEEFPWKLFLCQTIVMLLVNWSVRLLVVNPVVYRAMKWYSVQHKVVKYSTVQKYSQSFIECMFYSSGAIIGVLLCVDLTWLWPSVQWWMSRSNSLQPGIRFYYILNGAWYTQGLVCLLLEAKRKDFKEMLIHHIVSALLIFLSYQYGMVRVGFVIMTLFNFADPFLHGAKQVKYFADLRKQKGLCTLSTGADILFAGFVISFAVTRCVMYPFIVYSAVWEQYEYVIGRDGTMDILAYFGVIGSPTVVMIVLLCVLLLLQIFWLGLLFIVIYKLIIGKELSDARSDSESDSESLAKKDQ